MAPASSPTSSRVWALHLLISVFGITLRVWQYIVDRSLWHDEARLANAILSRSFIDLTKPMTEQISPIGFLLVERVNVTLFGMGEYALRLFPLVTSVIAVWLMWRVASAYLTGWGSTVALAMFATTDLLIYYASEVKQYSSDVLWTLLLLMAIRGCVGSGETSGAVFRFGALSAVLAWFSHPALFVAATGFGTLGLQLLTGPRSGRVAIHRYASVAGAGLLFAVSCVVLYLISWRFSATDYLAFYWRESFMPMPPWKNLSWFATTGYGLVNTLLGVNVVASERAVANFILGAVAAGLVAIGCVSYVFRQWQSALIITGPILAAFLASGLAKYPITSRLMLFAIPLLILLLGEGVERIRLVVGRWNPVAAMCVAALFSGALLYGPLTEALGDALHPPMREHIRPAMLYVRERASSSDIVYVGYVPKSGSSSVRYYGTLFGLGAQMRSAARPVNRDRREGFATELGGRRVWIVFSHRCARCDRGENGRLLRHVDSIGGVRLDAFESDYASVYLYELPQGEPRAASSG